MWPLVFGWLATRHRARLHRRLTGADDCCGRGRAVDRGRLGGRRRVLGDAGAAGRDPARRVAGGRRSTGRSLGGSVGAPRATGTGRAGAGGGRAPGRRWSDVPRRGCRSSVSASALLIAGLQVPGRLRSLLALAPLVGLGRISYGVYLYHWPIYVILDEARTGLSGPALLGLRLAVTGLAATLSFVLIERPIRRADWRPRPTLAGALVATVGRRRGGDRRPGDDRRRLLAGGAGRHRGAGRPGCRRPARRVDHRSSKRSSRRSSTRSAATASRHRSSRRLPRIRRPASSDRRR